MWEVVVTLICNPPRYINSYLKGIKKFPLLTDKEEKELTLLVYRSNDLCAARSLILSHLRFVVSIAKKYRGYGLGLADLIQEGNIGLMKAVKNYSPLVGVRLCVYAKHWIRSFIYDFILRNVRIVKVATTKEYKKLFFNIKKFKTNSSSFSNVELQEISKKLNVKEDSVKEMELRLSGKDVEISDNASTRDEPEHEIFMSDKKEALFKALGTLDKRSKDIIEARWLENDKSPLKDLSLRYGVSLQRIAQIETEAFEKIRKFFRSK